MDVNSRDPLQNILPFRIKGVEISRFDSSGNLGIGISSPSVRLDISGGAARVNSGAAATTALTTTGRIGVNTAAPTAPLDVTGDSILRNSVRIGSSVAPTVALDVTGAAIVTASSATSTALTTTGRIGVNQPSPTVDLDVSGAARLTASSSSATVLTTTGRIGVNTAVPIAALDVTGAGYFNSGSGSSSVALWTMGRVGVNNTAPQFDLDVTGRACVTASSATSTALTTTGRIGVNTAAPTAPLDVTGDTILRNSVRIGSSVAPTVALDVSGAAIVTASSATSTALTTTGRIGVNTAAPTAPLDVTGDTILRNSVRIGSSVAPTVALDVTGAAIVTASSATSTALTTTGRIGVNTAAPIADLDVSGTAKIGNVTIGTIPLYTFTSHTFTNASATGRSGPTLSAVRTAYSSASWAQNNSYLSMTSDNGIQLWTVPVTGTYTIQAVGAAGLDTRAGKGRDIQLTTTLIKGEVIRILVGQQGTGNAFGQGSGGGGTFVVRDTQTPIIVAGGGGGRGYAGIGSFTNAALSTSGNTVPNISFGGTNGQGGNGDGDGGGGGMFGNGSGTGSEGGLSFINGGLGGIGSNDGTQVNGGFGGGGGGNGAEGGGGGGGYSGGGGGGGGASSLGGGGGGSFGITTLTDNGAINTGHGSVTITLLSVGVDLDVSGVARISASSATSTALTTVGRIGVNTVTPTAPLDVSGNAILRNSVRIGSSAAPTVALDITGVTNVSNYLSVGTYDSGSGVTSSVLPNAFYVRTGGSNWRDYIPLLVADPTTNIQTWGGPDTQWYDVTYAPLNEVAKQYSYFAAYWLNANRAVVGTSFSVESYAGTGGSPLTSSRGTFTFTATTVSSGVVTGYSGFLSQGGYGTQSLTAQQDGIDAGVARRSIISNPNRTILAGGSIEAGFLGVYGRAQVNSGAATSTALTTTGRIGVNTAAPTVALDVTGAAKVSTLLSAQTGLILGDNTKTAMDVGGDGTTGCLLNLIDTGAPRMRFISGTTNSLDIGCSDSESFIWSRGDKNLGIATNNTRRMTITNQGYVGIGTGTPGYPVDIVGTLKSTRNFANSFWWGQGSAGNTINTNNVLDAPITMRLNGSVWIESTTQWVGFWATSDRRIKKNINYNISSECLNLFRQLKCSNYSYIDERENKRSVYGYIAQDVSTIIPYAVTTKQGFIPSLYSLGKISKENGLVKITCYEQKKYTFYSLHDNNGNAFVNDKNEPASDNNGGRHFKVKLCDISMNEYIVRIDEIIDNGIFTIETDETSAKLTDEEYFVFGQEIDDYKILNNEAITVVATAALQEVDRQQQADKARIAELEATVASQQTIINDILERLNSNGM